MLNVFKRQTFTGRSDIYLKERVYATPGPDEADPIWLAKSGTTPYDIDEVVLTADSRSDATTRLAGYTNYWNFYKGKHWTVPDERGLTKPVFNYCKDIVKITTEWVVANGFTITAAKGNEQIAELLNKFWKNCPTAMWTYCASMQYASITGDSYWMVVKRKGKKEITDTAIVPLNPAYVFPKWDTEGQLQAVMLQYPDLEGDLITVYFTKEYTKSYRNLTMESTMPNLIGELPVVHIPASYDAGSNFGISDLEGIIPLNVEVNSQAFLLKKIMHYQGSPTTLIFGMKYSSMERMADKVWSNLPPDARVENLKLDADLTPHMECLKEGKRQISRAARIPMFLLEPTEDTSQRVSNTSGIALEMLFGPLISKVEEKHKPLRQAFKQINKVLLKTWELHGMVTLSDLTDYPESRYVTDVIFGSKLPRDRQAELDVATKKVAMGIWSKAEAARRLAEVEDTERLAVELSADKIAEAMKQFEMQKAAKGIRPSAGFAYLDSTTLSEDLLDLAEETTDITEIEAVEASEDGTETEDDSAEGEEDAPGSETEKE